VKPLLPENYADLPPAEQKEARLAAYSPHGKTPEEFERAHGFFCDVCLGRKEDSPCPNGLFYKDLIHGGPPEFHRRIIRDIAQYPKVMVQWPRAACKTTVVTKSLPIWLAATNKPGRKFDILILTISEKKVSTIMDDISYQLRYNPVIRSEFGELHSSRHEGVWSHSKITLKNRCSITVAAWKSSSIVGERPDLIIIDDIEYHNKANRDPDATRDKIDDWMHHVIHPMLERKASILWISTLSRRDFYAYHAAKGKFDDTDERWTFWYRTTLSAEWIGPNGERMLLWPAKWDAEYLDAKRKELGDAAYSAQFCNEPGAEDVALFRMDDRYHQWWITRMSPNEKFERRRKQDIEDGKFVPRNARAEDSDFTDRPHPSFDPDPLTSDVVVHWNEPDERDYPIEKSEIASDLFPSFFRMITVDFASTVSSHSDYSGCMCSGFDALNRQWVLDMYLAKVSEEQLLQKVCEMADRWKVALVTVESVGKQATLRERVRTMAAALAQKGKHGFMVGGTKYHGMDKGSRIAGLEWRFTSNCMFLPREKKGDPTWMQLYDQIRLFTPDLSLLENDDAIDMLSMPAFAEGRGIGAIAQEKKVVTPEQQIAEGQPVDPRTGQQWGLCVPPSPSLTAKARTNKRTQKRRGGKWLKP